MKTAAQILRSKPDQAVYTMEPTASAHEAVGLMADKNIGALLVVESGNVVGIELNATYVKSATSGVVTAVCTPVRRGRTLATFVIQVSDQAGRPTASVRPGTRCSSGRTRACRTR